MANAPKPSDNNDKRSRFSLSGLFTRKAKRVMPPIPEDVLNNKHLQKEILRRRRKKLVRNIGLALAFSGATSAVTLHNPKLVSEPFNQFMAENGYPDNLKDHYHAPNIYVYQRDNVLYPFHMAGNETRIIWHENMQQGDGGVIGLALETPVIYTKALMSGFGQMLFPNMLDAYSMSNNDDPSTRTCFIRPPAEFSVAEFFRDFSSVNAKSFHFQHSEQDLKKVLFEYVMLHEARHCDQEKEAYITANESDADLYAFRVLKARGTDPGLLQEAAEIIVHLRAINAVMHGDTAHVSTFALERGGESMFTSHQDAAAFKELSDLIDETLKYNQDTFPEKMSGGLRAFYATVALYDSGLLKSDPQVTRAAASFVNALGYFDKISGGKLIDQNFDIDKVDLSYLAGKYVPVPDKLDVPAATPNHAPRVKAQTPKTGA